MFCLNLMRIALELARENRTYEALATKFFQHYVLVAGAMKHMGNRDYSLWDEEDGFFYDVLRYPDGRFHKLRVRSLVGLIPLFAVERLEESWIEPFTEFRESSPLVPRAPQGAGQRRGPHHRARARHHPRPDDPQPGADPPDRPADHGPERVPLRLRRPEPLQGPRRTPRSSSTARPSATSPPRRSAS